MSSLASETWYVACGVWHVVCGMWYVARGREHQKMRVREIGAERKGVTDMERKGVTDMERQRERE